MNPLAEIDVDTIISGRADWIDSQLQTVLAEYPLDCIETE
jgi:hypothetical protein